MLLGLDLGGWERQLLAGAAVTVALAVATLPLGLFVGIAVALAKDSRSRAWRAFGEGFTTVFRGLPELLTLLLVYYGLQIGIRELSAAVGVPVAVELNPFAAGILSLGLVFGAYSSEVFLGAIRAVERGQVEAALSFGMGPAKIFLRVTWPQVLRIALPGLGNNWLVLLKDTSLVSVIALDELLRKTYLAVGSTKQPFLFYGVACLFYLALTAISNVALARIEKRANRGWSPA